MTNQLLLTGTGGGIRIGARIGYEANPAAGHWEDFVFANNDIGSIHYGADNYDWLVWGPIPGVGMGYVNPGQMGQPLGTALLPFMLSSTNLTNFGRVVFAAKTGIASRPLDVLDTNGNSAFHVSSNFPGVVKVGSNTLNSLVISNNGVSGVSSLGSGTNAPSIYIATNGNAGIGTNAPSTTLDIQGTFRVYNNATFGTSRDTVIGDRVIYANAAAGAEMDFGSQGLGNISVLRGQSAILRTTTDVLTVTNLNVGIGTTTPTNTLSVNGTTMLQSNVLMSTNAALVIASGPKQRAGNTTLVGGTVTVANTSVTTSTIVMLTRKTSGGTIGTAITYTLSAGTSFTVNSDNILDTSTFSYFLIENP